MLNGEKGYREKGYREKCHIGKNVTVGEMLQGKTLQGELLQGELSWGKTLYIPPLPLFSDNLFRSGLLISTRLLLIRMNWYLRVSSDLVRVTELNN